jgi:protein-S-isoprenylcysteine O-methyltransferase Ste14
MKRIGLELGETASLWLDACLCLAFFVQHSVMIRRSFRQRLARFLPKEFDSALFAIASGLFLIVLIAFWQESSCTVAKAPGFLSWVLRVVYFLSLAGFFWGMRALGVFDPFGVIPLRNYLRGRQSSPVPFVVRGPYRWVRHPLYLFLIFMTWSYPDLTADRLLFNVLWTTWIVVGTVLEERDLAASFGDAYCAYQLKVPMLIPYRIPSGS